MSIYKSIKQIGIFVLFFGANSLFAQQAPNFTLYQYNKSIINPAEAGSNDVSEFIVSHRTQWLGVDNGPSTQSFSYSMPLNNKIGIGVSVINDRIFVLKETDLAVNVSYKIRLLKEHDLIFGLKAGGGFVDVNLDRAGANQIDPLFASNESFSNPHIGAGLLLRHKRYYVGLSIPNFLNGDRYVKKGNIVQQASDNAHVYLNGAYMFPVHKNIVVTPAVLVRYVEGAPNSYDVSATGEYAERMSLGGKLSCR